MVTRSHPQPQFPIATEQGWPDNHDAEYIALTRLHRGALIARDDARRKKPAGLVRTETVDHLFGSS